MGGSGVGAYEGRGDKERIPCRGTTCIIFGCLTLLKPVSCVGLDNLSGDTGTQSNILAGGVDLLEKDKFGASVEGATLLPRPDLGLDCDREESSLLLKEFERVTAPVDTPISFLDLS